MPTHKTIKELPERLERRKFLFELEAQIEAREEYEFTATQLQSLNIDVQHMTLDRKSHSKPNFFAPRPNLPEPSDDDLEISFRDSCNEEDEHEDEDYGSRCPKSYAYETEIGLPRYASNWLDEDSHAIQWSWKCSGDYKSYKSLYHFDEKTHLRFNTFRLMDVRGKKFPHIKAVAYDEWPGNEQTITRGELLTILRLMFTQMKQLRFIEHMLAPVFLVSLLGKNVRAIESYYDGNHFVLRYTPFLRIPEQDYKNTLMSFKKITEWYIGDPIGITL